MDNTFTDNIKIILENNFKVDSTNIFKNSELIQYINYKTKSANKGSKSRSSFANLYAIYVLVEDYINNNYHLKGEYSKYKGAIYNDLFIRQRELPFGNKLQNHALNNRTNSEFQKYFPTSDLIPIFRDLETNRYWINENLLMIKVGKVKLNLATTIIDIIDEYIKTKKSAFEIFINTCLELQNIDNTNTSTIEEFILKLLDKNVDARLFEIVSYSILKFYYYNKKIFWGYDIEKLNEENLKLFKTGRTNANDGGIDFVMKPLGRFFQVTESLDFKKYFLDIDKVQKYPITFVIKSDETIDIIMSKIKSNANKIYTIESIADKYMNCNEEIVNINTLKLYLEELKKQNKLNDILEEIILQSKVEFNI